jgi:cell wall-associated NlpC family hydrolase
VPPPPCLITNEMTERPASYPSSTSSSSSMLQYASQHHRHERHGHSPTPDPQDHSTHADPCNHTPGPVPKFPTRLRYLANQFNIYRRIVFRQLAGPGRQRQDGVFHLRGCRALVVAVVTYQQGMHKQYLAEAQQAVTGISAGLPTSPTGPSSSACTTPVSVGAGGGPVRQAAVTYALAQRGKPYVWGATGPNGFGLTSAAYRSAGVTIPRTAGEQMRSTARIQPGQEGPGDLVFTELSGNDAGHVLMVVSVSGGTMTLVEAPHTGDVVKTITLSDAGAVLGRVKV